jgi:hypothetical protein
MNNVLKVSLIVVGGFVLILTILTLLTKYGQKKAISNVPVGLEGEITEVPPDEDFADFENAEPVTNKIPVDFSEFGNLVNVDENSEPLGYWKFVYERPGQPALSVRVEFVPGSICQEENGPEQDCSSMTFSSGDQVNLDGKKEGETITVSRIVRIK